MPQIMRLGQLRGVRDKNALPDCEAGLKMVLNGDWNIIGGIGLFLCKTIAKNVG